MDRQLLEKFYQNKCTLEEVKEVLKWFEQENPGADQQQVMQEIWHESGEQTQGQAYAHDADKIFEAILSKRAAGEVTSVSNETPVRELYPQPWRKYMRIAAAVLLPLCFIWLLVSRHQQNDAVQFVTVETQHGVKKTIKLADGSVVKLNSGSSLTYPDSFGATRELSLKGEAFFEVAEDSLRPFIVHTGQLRTQVLGTSFNISSLEKDSTISIALATGVVKVGQSSGNTQTQQLAQLEPGQQLVFNKVRNSYEVALYDQAQVLSWKDGVLYFKDASFDKVVSELERWYGVRLEVAELQNGHEAEWHYTGKYDRQSLETVLKGISFVKKFSYSKKDSSTFVLTLPRKPQS